jgi:hypothetical protein
MAIGGSAWVLCAGVTKLATSGQLMIGSNLIVQRIRSRLFASGLCVQTQPLALPSPSTASTSSTQMREDRHALMRVVSEEAGGPLAPLEPRQKLGLCPKAHRLDPKQWSKWVTLPILVGARAPSDAAHCRKPAIIRR